MKTAHIRKLFLDYFKENGHRITPGGPLAPPNDTSLLFTNSGMVQFKDVFLGYEKFPTKRAVTVQPCLRAGGKHNDLENVGYTARHHTFFEMLGNFSFGDYFKKPAIEYAWNLLTGPIGLPPEKLWVTVYEEDDEAAELWLQHIGVDPSRFVRVGAADNFWSMGDTGPCGPCTEVFYDHGPEVRGSPPGSGGEGEDGEDGDRYIEIWNLVFMQFNRDASGALQALPRPSVDTGMGLERIAAVLQGVTSNYDIDLFRNLIAATATVLNVRDRQSQSLRVIADHLRAAVFLIAEGILPSNEGRGYVLRRIIRRAIRHGYQLGRRTPFMHELVPALVHEMGEAYPHLSKARARVENSLQQEGQRFMETLEQGLKLLAREMNDARGDVISGDVVFKLHDTFGFPPDLVNDAARENNMRVDMDGYEMAMQKQRKRARASRAFSASDSQVDINAAPTRFIGYDILQSEAAVVALVQDGREVTSIAGDDEVMVILDATPFYAESGGQVGDRGRFTLHKQSRGKKKNTAQERAQQNTDDTSPPRFDVKNTRRLPNELIAHCGHMLHGTLKIGDKVHAEVNVARRAATVANHSATHLLHAALQKVLGDHVQQKGSLVAPARLRFDFSHTQPLAPDQLLQIESCVNHEVRANHPVHTRTMTHKKALAAGAMALFGEKYGERVRVVGIGDSLELCGGTHVARSGDIGLVKITSESGVAAGVRRIEALSTDAATQYVATLEAHLDAVTDALQCTRTEAPRRIVQLRERNRELEQRVESLRLQHASASTKSTARHEHIVDGVRLLVARYDDLDPKALRRVMDGLRNELSDSVLVTGAVCDARAHIAVSVPSALTERVHAGRLAGELAEKINGNGGGSATLGQGGGDESGLQGALAAMPEVLSQHLAHATEPQSLAVDRR